MPRIQTKEKAVPNHRHSVERHGWEGPRSLVAGFVFAGTTVYEDQAELCASRRSPDAKDRVLPVSLGHSEIPQFR